MSALKITILLFLLPGLLIWRTAEFYRSRPVYHDGQRLKVHAQITEEPEITTGKQRIKVRTQDGIRATITTQTAPIYTSGEKIVIDGVFTKKRFQDFDYWAVFFPNIQIATSDHNIVTSMAAGLRNEAKKLVENTLPPVPAGLLLGIVLGGKHGMPDDFLEKLRTVGVLHVIAASGMNVSFVAAFLVITLGKVLRRQFALFTAIIGIGFYVTVAGFEPSIVRAAVMSSLALTAALLGRQSVAVVILSLTGYLMLMVSPGLWEDVGFQLSFLATLGILTVKPVLEGGFGWKAGIAKLAGEDVTTTIAAQIATLPVLLGVFGSYGLLSVLVNALILWTVPVLMTLGSLGIISGIVFAPLGQVFLFLCYPFLWFFETVINLFGSTGWILEIPKVSPLVWIGYYLVLGAVVWGKRKRLISETSEYQSIGMSDRR